MAEKKQAKEKPLEKMTAKELRDLAKEIPEIVGVHGMNKAELISAIKQARGIPEEVRKKSDASVRDIKKKIRTLKARQQSAREAEDSRLAAIYRRRVSRLKKKTRRAV
jgi:hypothetical protein